MACNAAVVTTYFGPIVIDDVETDSETGKGKTKKREICTTDFGVHTFIVCFHKTKGPRSITNINWKTGVNDVALVNRF